MPYEEGGSGSEIGPRVKPIKKNSHAAWNSPPIWHTTVKRNVEIGPNNVREERKARGESKHAHPGSGFRKKREDTQNDEQAISRVGLFSAR